ncbi:MAG: glycosyltransferase family 4 protein [Gallionellaceae bacterium]|nr:glycosyltransferase family 4 protein [Gallionellaceae bacterium]
MSKSAPTIVMVGTALDAPGGMTSVIKTYRDCGFFEQWNITYLSSYQHPGWLMQCRVMARALAQFLLLLLRGKVALLHVHSASRGSFWRKSLFCAMARVFGVPYIFHVHSGDFPLFIREECGVLAQAWANYTLRRAQCVVALTASWRAALQALSPTACITVLGNPVATPQHIGARREHTSHVLFLGRLHSSKGVFDLVHAMPQVLAKVPQATFTLAGDGDLAGVASLAQTLGVEHALNLPGWVEGAAKDALLATADVLVLPSYFEGLPICVLEAMAHGIPVVSTAIGGVPEALEHGASGALVAPGDSAALAAALIDTLLDREGSEHKRQRAFARVREHYSTSAILGALTELYRGKILSTSIQRIF